MQAAEDEEEEEEENVSELRLVPTDSNKSGCLFLDSQHFSTITVLHKHTTQRTSQTQNTAWLKDTAWCLISGPA